MASPHRVLIIGAGSIGERHVRCFAATGRCEVGVVETQPHILQKVASEYSIGSAFASIDHAQPKSWDAAVIATPADTHVTIARRLAELGLHLLIEKPLATALDGVPELISSVNRSGIVSAVAYVWRAHRLSQKLRELIQSGKFGAPVQLCVSSGQHFPTYRPAYRKTYYAQRSTGGGAIQDALTHLLNLGEWLIGPIDRVSADAAHQVLDGVEVEDTVHVIARHGQALASYTMNQHQAPNETIITAVCARGTLRLHLQNGTVSSMTEPGGDWKVELSASMERDEWFIAQANAFLDAVSGRAAVLCSVEEAANTLRVVIATLGCVEDQKTLRRV